MTFLLLYWQKSVTLNHSQEAAALNQPPTDTLAQPENYTATSSIPKDVLCSFCYICGKEFDITQYDSHECRVHTFEFPDSDEGLENSENDDTLELSTIQNKEADVVSTVAQNSECDLESSAKHRNNISVEIQDEEKLSNSTEVTRDSSINNMTLNITVDYPTRSIQNSELTIQPNQSNFDAHPVAIIEITEKQENYIVESISKNAQNKSYDPITTHSMAHQSLHDNPLVNPYVSRGLTENLGLPDEVKGTTQKSDLPSLDTRNSTLCENTSSNTINNISALNFSVPVYNHPGTLFKTVESSSLGQNVDMINSEISQNSCLSGASLSTLNTVTQNTDRYENIPPSEETFCEFCGLLVSNIKDLQAHQLILHELEHFSCFFCENIFNETNELIIHLKVKHQEMSVIKAEVNYVAMRMAKNKCIYYCNQCGQGFNLIHKLLNHKRELIKSGKHFSDEKLNAIGNYLENPKKKSVKALTLSSKRKTIVISTNEKDNRKINGGAQDLCKIIDNKAPKSTKEIACHVDFTKKQVSVENKIEICSEASKNKNNEKKCLIQTSEQKKAIDTKTQEYRNSYSVHNKKIEDQKDNTTITDQNLKQSCNSSKTKTAKNDKEIYVKHTVNTEKDKKQKSFSLIRQKENKKITDTQNHSILLNTNNKQIKENKTDSNTETTNKNPKRCEKRSGNKNTPKKMQLKGTSKYEEVMDRKLDDDRQSKNYGCTSQKVINIEHETTTDNRKVIESKQAVSKQKNTSITSKWKQDKDDVVVNFIDSGKDIKKKSVQKNNNPGTTKKYEERNIEKNLIPKNFKIKTFCVLLKREKIENMTCKRTNKSYNKAKDKKLSKIEQSDNEARHTKIAENNAKNEDSLNKTKYNGSDNIIAKKHKSFLRIKEFENKKEEKSDKRISTDITHSPSTDKIKKLKESLLKIQVIKNKEKEKTVKCQSINIEARNDKSSNKVGKNSVNLKHPPKCRKRIIGEFDIFGANKNLWAEPKKKLQFTKVKNAGTIISKNNVSGKEPSRNDPNRNDSNENKSDKQSPNRNDLTILEPSKTEIEQENKKKLSLQQYKGIRNIVSHKPQDPSSLIINGPHISEHNMGIINEAVQKIGIYYTIQQRNSDAAKFSDDAESDVDFFQENVSIIFCEVCGSQCQNVGHLRKHMAFMHQGFNFICFVCDRNFSTLDAVIDHQIKYSKDILMSAESQFLRRRKSMFHPYYCNHCGKGFTLIDLVAIHKKQNHDKRIKNGRTDLKNADYKEISDLVQKDNQNKEEEEVSILMTSALNTPETSRRNSLEISEDEINAEYNLRNDISNINTETNSLTDKHNKLDTSSSETPINVSSDPSFPRFCESCGRKHLSILDQQIDLHLEKFKCTICRSPYETIDLLVTHYDLRHPKHEVENFEYAQRSMHNYHYSFYCKFCGQGFNFIGELVGHRACVHLELLQKEKDDQVDKRNGNNCKETMAITKPATYSADAVTSKHSNINQTPVEKDCSETVSKDIRNNLSPENNTTNNKTKLNIDLKSPSIPDINHKEIPKAKQNNNQIDLNKKSLKDNNELDLSNICDDDSNLNSMIIDLEEISSAEESESSNFVDVEEFMKEKHKKSQFEKPYNNDEKTYVPKAINSTDTLASKSDKLNDLAKQITDELSVMDEDDLLNNSQGEQLIIEDQVSIPTDDNLLENCHEDVVEISPSAQNYMNQGQLDTTPSFCEACGKKFLSKVYAKHHFYGSHRPFRCSVCDKRFTFLHKLIKHQNFKYRLPTLEYAEKESLKFLLSREVPEHFRYYCDVCGKGFNYIYDLKSHRDLNCPMQPKNNILTNSISETIDNGCDTSLSKEDKRNKEVTMTVTSETNILENMDFNVQSPSEAPSESLIINKTAMSTAHSKDINSTNKINKENKPTCNNCGKKFSLCHLLNEHRVQSCIDKNNQDNKNISCNTHLDCQNSTLTASSTNENISIKEKKALTETHSCLSCGKTFLYTCELTWHTFKGCPTLQTTFNSVQLIDTPQMSSEIINISIPLELVKNAAQSSVLHTQQPFTSEHRENAKPFNCPVCPERSFGSEDGLNQHIKNSKKHIKRAERKKQISTENSNLPLTYLITEADSTTSNQAVGFSNSLSHYSKKNSKSPDLSPFRNRSRSPPRSRKLTELSDLRRRSIERELDTKGNENKSKKEQKNTKKRLLKRSESKERKVKKPRYDGTTESVIKEELSNDSIYIRKFENATRRRRRQRRYRKQVDKATDVSSIERKKQNGLDDFEGIYTLKELEKICPSLREDQPQEKS